jgi:hypothetical protein
MTNEAAIAAIAEKFKTVRRCKDGSIMGPSINGFCVSLSNTFIKNGMDQTKAYREAWIIVHELAKQF